MQITHNDIALHYQDSGNHNLPTIVLVFGFAMSMQTWSDLGYIENLNKHFRTIAIEPRGHGLSTAPLRPEDYSSPI